MKIEAETWKAINEPVKHLFDSLRNLGISASVVAAANFFETSKAVGISEKDITFMRAAGYFLAATAVAHFVLGLIFHIPVPKRYSRVLPPRPNYALHLYLCALFLGVSYFLYRYLTSK